MEHLHHYQYFISVFMVIILLSTLYKNQASNLCAMLIKLMYYRLADSELIVKIDHTFLTVAFLSSRHITEGVASRAKIIMICKC